jgi:hypothetical protein
MPLCAAQHHDANRVIMPGILKSRKHLVDREGSEGIEHLWTIDGHPRYAVSFGIENILKFLRHGPSPSSAPVCGDMYALKRSGPTQLADKLIRSGEVTRVS